MSHQCCCKLFHRPLWEGKPPGTTAHAPLIHEHLRKGKEEGRDAGDRGCGAAPKAPTCLTIYTVWLPHDWLFTLSNMGSSALMGIVEGRRKRGRPRRRWIDPIRKPQPHVCESCPWLLMIGCSGCAASTGSIWVGGDLMGNKNNTTPPVLPWPGRSGQRAACTAATPQKSQAARRKNKNKNKKNSSELSWFGLWFMQSVLLK